MVLLIVFVPEVVTNSDGQTWGTGYGFVLRFTRI